MPLSPSPTLTDKLSLLPNLLRALLATLAHGLLARLLGRPRANTTFKDLVFAFLRFHLRHLRPGTEQWILPARGREYHALATRKGFPPETTTLQVAGGEGVNVRWIGPKTSAKVLLYFHGGGFVLPASPGHWDWLFEVQRRLAGKVEGGFSVVVPEYTLAPWGQYPRQLRQGTEVLRWLIKERGFRAENILVAGDSAGGNLSLALLLHLLHPHPSLPAPPKLAAPLAGAVLISPWCKFATDDASFTRNEGSDMVAPEAVERWAGLYMGPALRDAYNQPGTADPSFFQGLEKVVKDILILGGGAEVLIDSIVATGEKLQAAHPRTEVVVEPGCSHVDFILEVMLGYSGREGSGQGQGRVIVEDWMEERVK